MTTHDYGLSYKQKLAEFNQTIITINIVELASELADLDLRENWKDSIKILSDNVLEGEIKTRSLEIVEL